MDCANFITVGENIHCTRIVKRGGTKTTETASGQEAVAFTYQGNDLLLPIPTDWATKSPDFDKGKVKHVALAVTQARDGSGEARELGEAYLCYLAERQIARNATFLDVNVDEYSNDRAEVNEVMTWLVQFLSDRYDTPLSIDSSAPETLKAGLSHCRQDIRKPMVNSFSLERPSIIDVVVEYEADAIVSAAGVSTLPADTDERLTNFRNIVGQAAAKGMAIEKMHLDPLVLPVSTDSMNGKHFLDATAACHREWPGAHLNGGLSNISFGMPNRKLLNMVFCWLCVEAGTDGGIIDPVVMPIDKVAALDAASEPFQLAKGVLTGEDLFGMEYITAYRDGRLKD